MRRLVQHNVNHKMRLRITEAGRRAWDRYYEGLGMKAPPVPVDRNGFTTDQTWSLMQILSPAIRMGIDPPFEPTVWFEVDDGEPI